MKRKTQITLTVTLDENNTPEAMEWSAPDGGVKAKSMEAFFLSTWDKDTQESARIDLWSKEMPVDQMQVFVHQTLVGIHASYLKATDDVQIGEAMQQFCDFFASERNLKDVKKGD
ncbi:MAG: gliding motility protein GldC [Flavobacteriaceae bacterium]|nr:gliding motility protein GldC [Flavobacteriaceae bacterium]|tara:strand:- start:1081 stop:1425 length:345 start_codon:yes stop_codon:yes gene_type:complete